MKSLRRYAILAAGICLSFAAVAAPPEKPKATPDKKASKPYKIIYGSASWNTDSTKFDQAYMFIREKNTGKIAKLLLEETEPDSSIFSGSFALDWKIDGPATMEAYVFAENMRNDEKELARVTEIVKSGKVKPSPIVSREEKGLKIIDVYDTREQANRAREAYENRADQQKLAEKTKSIQKSPIGQPVATGSPTVAAEKALALTKLAEEAAKREADRIRLEQVEAQRLKLLAEQNALLSKLEREKQKRSAEEWQAKGVAAYKANDFATAEAAFSKAVELDPNNKTPYFMYGVSLYRNEKLNDAQVALKLSTNAGTDKNFYLGLVHFRLKEYKNAKREFVVVEKDKSNSLSTTATFYLGIIYFNEEDFDKSKTAFEWFIDNSNDAALDRQAEQYLENIAAALAAKKESERKWSIVASGGIVYDSNILLATDSDTTQGTALDVASVRYLASADVDYRFYYKTESELAAKLSTSYMYSADTDYAPADPFLITVGLPYTRKGTWKGKSYRAALTPAYEKIYMDVNADDTRETILDTIIATGDVTFVETPNHFAGYTVEVRQEDSSLTTSTGDDDLDSTKVTLKTQHTYLIDDAKKKAVVGLAGFTWNEAKGDNKKFHRFDIGAVYLAPWKKFTNTTWNTGLTAYKLDYSSSATNRSDTNFSFLLGMSKVLSDRWTWTLNGSYTNNASSDSDYQYSKHSAMLLATYNWSK